MKKCINFKSKIYITYELAAIVNTLGPGVILAHPLPPGMKCLKFILWSYSSSAPVVFIFVSVFEFNYDSK